MNVYMNIILEDGVARQSAVEARFPSLPDYPSHSQPTAIYMRVRVHVNFIKLKKYLLRLDYHKNYSV